MQTVHSRSGRRSVLAACAATVSLAAPGAAAAQPVAADLRVEATAKALAVGHRYLTDATRLQTDTSPSCGGSGQVKALAGPTPLGIVESAGRIDRALRPLSVSDRFSFGLFVCGIGGLVGGETSFWLYKVDHVAPEVGADQFALKEGQQVLWYFQDTASGANTGDELELVAPARARSGQSFEVTVYAYDFAGRRRPAPGALVHGPSVQRTDARGRARVFSGKRGYLRLRAVRGADIASAPVHVCLNRVLGRCPAARGKRVFGSNDADRIEGTPGADVIYGRGGADRVDVRGGSRDRVRCGRGRDVVRLGRGDRAARDCERVRRR